MQIVPITTVRTGDQIEACNDTEGKPPKREDFTRVRTVERVPHGTHVNGNQCYTADVWRL